MKNEKIIILGQSGSGKSYLLSKLAEKGLKTCLKWTTRPIRQFEQQGIHYNFVEDSTFIKEINENNFLAYQTFTVTPENSDVQTWYYGITKEEFKNAQAFIMTPGEFRELDPELRKECFVVYLDIDRDVREKRVLKRDDKNDSVKRRLDSDEIDFKNDFDYDLRIKDPDFDVDDVYNLMN